MRTSYVDDVLLAATSQALEYFKYISRKRFDVTIDNVFLLGYVSIQITNRSTALAKFYNRARHRESTEIPSQCELQHVSFGRSVTWVPSTDKAERLLLYLNGGRY